MNVDRIARAMTGGGPSRAFKARVMAPIHGRPRPDFTDRVMNRVEAREVAQPFTARGLLVPVTLAAALALAAGMVLFRDSRVTTPPAPVVTPLIAEAPKVVTPAPAVGSVAPKLAQQGARAPRMRSRSVTPASPPETAEPNHSPIYTIAALETTPGIGTRSIEPTSCTIPPLEGPAPLKFATLPAAAGGTDKKDSKEK